MTTKDQNRSRNVRQPEEDPENYYIGSQLLLEMIKMEVGVKKERKTFQTNLEEKTAQSMLSRGSRHCL
jgi:hypothetical protein